jgi:hypothetical protein
MLLLVVVEGVEVEAEAAGVAVRWVVEADIAGVVVDIVEVR